MVDNNSMLYMDTNPSSVLATRKTKLASRQTLLDEQALYSSPNSTCNNTPHFLTQANNQQDKEIEL